MADRTFDWLLNDSSGFELPEMTPEERRVFSRVNRLCIGDAAVINGKYTARLDNRLFSVNGKTLYFRVDEPMAVCILKVAQFILNESSSNLAVRDITPQQKRILNWLKDYVQKHGRFPSLKEMSAAFGVNTNTIALHLKALKNHGYIEYSREQRSVL